MSNHPTIKTEWSPHPGQLQVLQSDARFRIVACGRRWGKTEMCANDAAARLGSPGTLVWWVAPTYDIADLGFDAVGDALPEAVIAETKRTKPKAYELVNGATISFRSADREDSLRGEGLDLLIIDEAAMVPERAWTEELRPTLSDTLGEMIAISTPKGRGWFHRWHARGDDPDHPNTDSWQSSTYENPHVPDSEIDDARNEVPDRVFEQEYLAEFKEESGGVFTGLDDRLFTADYELPVAPADAEAPFATGVDLARHQDYRVIVTLDATGRVVYFDRDQGEAWPEIQRAVESVAEDYPGLVGIDASRDNKLVADLENAGLQLRPVKFSSSRKQDLIESLIATVEAGELTAPEIPALRHELEVFEVDVTGAGNVRYDAPAGFHDDTIDALALASEGLADVTRQAAGTTARIGGDDDAPDGDDLDAMVEQQVRSRQNPWK